MSVIANLFGKEVKERDLVVPNLFSKRKSSLMEQEAGYEIVKKGNRYYSMKKRPPLINKEKTSYSPKATLKKNLSYLSSFIEESFTKPIKTFYGGTLTSSANFADTLDFYADKIAQILGLPETKDSIFEYLRDNWSYWADKLQKEGVSNKIAKAVYFGLGQACFEIPKLMALGPYGLVISGAAEGYKEGEVKGALAGGTVGVLTKGMLKGLNVLPIQAKIPVAFGTGAITTPGDIEEKIAGGAVLAGLSLWGKSPTMKEFKATQSKYSPLVKGYRKVLPYETRERIYQNYINRFQSIENTVQKAKELGAKILPGENPALRARTYLSVGNKVHTVLENKTYRITPQGKIEITGEGLKPILDYYDKRSPIKGRVNREKDLVDYLIASRTIKDLQRPKAKWTKEQIATSNQVGQAKATLNNLNKKYGKNITHLEQTAQRLYAYQKRVLHTLVDSGNMSQQQYDLILARNPNYIPFDRVIESVDTSSLPVSKKRFTGARSPIKRIKGSELEIHNPIESMIKNTYRIMDIAERNTVARGVAKLSKVLPEDISPVKIPIVPLANAKKVLTKIIKQHKELKPLLKIRPSMVAQYEKATETIFGPSPFKPKGNVIEYFENGKRQYIEVTPNLYQAMTGLNETSLGLMTEIMSKPAHWLRVGATITPEFMFRNPIRDQLTALMQTNFGFKPFVDTGGSIADILGKSEVYVDWLRSGGAYSGFVELSRSNLQKSLKELQRRPSLLKNLNIISKAQDISQLFEQATRLGVYKRAIKKGMTPVEAGYQSREATVDFARKGAKTKDINAVIAFFNAGIQGIDKSFRTAKADPAGFAIKGITSITIPSLLLYLKNRNDPDYKEIPRWERDLFWVTKVRNTYVRVPKPFLYGQIFGSLPERFMEYLDTQDPGAFDKIDKSLYDALLPVSGDPASGILATAIKPLIENATNWSFFRERPIVPESRERLLPEEQYGKYTTETAKLLGKVGKYPPAKIENLAQGWFGGTGKYALEAGDMLIKGIKKASGEKVKPERPAELSDFPLVKGFVTRPAMSSGAESIQQFYENKNELSKAYYTYRNYLKKGDRENASKIKSKYPNLTFARILNKQAKILSNLTKQIEIIIKSEEYSESEKRKLINGIEKRRVEIARKGLSLIKKAKSLVVPDLFGKGKNKSLVMPNLFD
ncbi:MAG: hypothetical protein DRP74_02650 [Candidatus Omnitrophota bacterium]|nr:MAG: hypothetical protein DRP74_02650 [Candidatus Omnitrophota bacterium]